MLIDGEKWACEACVRGHRVTTCKHHDRPLIRINKKGRPFATCPICQCTPCKSPEEHARIKREAANAKSSKKATENPTRGSQAGFVPIAPRPSNPAAVLERPRGQIPSRGNPVTSVSVSMSATSPTATDMMISSGGRSGYYPFGSSSMSSLTVSSTSMGGISVTMPMVNPYGEGSSLLEGSSFIDHFGYLEDMDMLPADGPSGEDWSNYSNYYWSPDDVP